MAVIVQTGIAGELRGKLDGQVFYRNRYGPIVRKNVIPTDPKTPAQIVVRNNFSLSTALWDILFPSQRVAWQNFADTSLTTKFGQTPGKLSGHDAFHSCGISARNAQANSIQTDQFATEFGDEVDFSQPLDPPLGMITGGMVDISNNLFPIEIQSLNIGNQEGLIDTLDFRIGALGSPPSPYLVNGMLSKDSNLNNIPCGFIANISEGMKQQGVFYRNQYRYSTDAYNPVINLSIPKELDNVQIILRMPQNKSAYQSLPRQNQWVLVTLFQISFNGMFRVVGSKEAKIT